MRLQTLLDKRVFTAEGECLGRIYDFRAYCDESEMMITHLVVGMAAWINRLHPRGWLRYCLNCFPDRAIPWEMIATIDKDVHLKPVFKLDEVNE